MEELPKTYEHQTVQARWYPYWLEKGYFHSEPDPNKKPFCIVIPPPNVTGALHLGHALNNTLQDSLIRFKRMQGFNALWMPGTDHAGIATQAVVERRLLEEEKKSRHDLGREALVERIWAWKAQYETRITGQLQQMGCSCDWQRQRFTLDEQCARAVRHTFFRMFKDGLIYRGKRLINWDTFLQTAVSDDEVFNESIKGKFWHFRYPVIDPKRGEPTHVTIATTRPETMLGDTAVAVHPDPAKALDKFEKELQTKLAETPAKDKPQVQAQLDELAERRRTLLPELIKLRDMALAGRKVKLPLLGRDIPLVADEWAKPELGSGCVKITPAHDPNDYEVGKRGNLPMINILNPDGTLNAEAGPYQGLTIAQARKQVVADLEAQELLDKVEDRDIELPMSDRSKTPIEPYLADQWFVRMDKLAQSAMDAVTDGKVKIAPERYAKSYLDWLGEKRDWPVSRQLWWGHRIPIWQGLIQLNGNSTTTELSITHDLVKKFFSGFLSAAGVSEKDYSISFSDDVNVRICPGSERAHQALSALEQYFQSYKPSRLGPGDIPLSQLRSVPSFPEATSVADELIFHLLDFTQDPDVLDTWFSSALWPFSTLGWPEETAELKYYYPTSALLTSRDIITLWVARMVLAGLYNLGEIPFHQVFIHPKILDGFGETMSKSKGNGVDPLDVIDKFGADSLRFALAHMCTETQDVRMPVEFECPHCGALVEQTKKNRVQPRVECKKCGKPFRTQWASKPEDMELPRGPVVSDRFELGRNFCNKLWNAARFALMNLEGYTAAPVDPQQLTLEDRWLLSRLSTVTQQVTEAFDSFMFADASRVLYDFAWNEFCSFYVEMAKPRLQDSATRATTQRVLAHTLDELMRLLHPLIPFITEEVWHRLGEVAPQRGLKETTAAAPSIVIAAWPVADLSDRAEEIESRFGRFQEVLGGLREIRARQNIPPREPIRFVCRCDEATRQLLEPMAPYFASMAGATCDHWGSDAQPYANTASFTAAGAEVHVDLADFIDVEAEIARLTKDRERLEQGIANKQRQLGNENFVARAPAEVIAKERAALAQMEEQLTANATALAALRAKK